MRIVHVFCYGADNAKPLKYFNFYLIHLNVGWTIKHLAVVEIKFIFCLGTHIEVNYCFVDIIF